MGISKGEKNSTYSKNDSCLILNVKDGSSSLGKGSIMNKKGKSLADRIPSKVWLLLSFATAMLLWYILSVIPATSRAFPNVVVVLSSIQTMISRGVLWKDISSSLISVAMGYVLGFVIALPVAILMAWYKPVRFILEPWIQFIRNIPPLAYVPLIVIAAGVGRKPQVIVITIACFLTMCITIYQGVINVDETLIKAARVLGATDKDIFIRVIAPATLPFILTAVRLGASVALTTLIAAESTGAVAGLGMRIRSLNNSFESAPMLLYIIIIGILGITIEKVIKYLERRLTSWQEKREI
jgi:NitT/TauT family transport system permease protein